MLVDGGADLEFAASLRRTRAMSSASAAAEVQASIARRAAASSKSTNSICIPASAD